MVVIRTYISKAFISNCYLKNIGIIPTVSETFSDVYESMTSTIVRNIDLDLLTLKYPRCTFFNYYLSYTKWSH